MQQLQLQGRVRTITWTPTVRKRMAQHSLDISGPVGHDFLKHSGSIGRISDPPEDAGERLLRWLTTARHGNIILVAALCSVRIVFAAFLT